MYIKEHTSEREQKENLNERIEHLKERLMEESKEREEKIGKPRKELVKVEAGIEKEREESKELERKLKVEKMPKAMDSEKEMERKVEAALEQMKILNLDFGSEFDN